MGSNIRGSSSLNRRDQKKYFTEASKQNQDVDVRLSNLETSEKQVLRMVHLSAYYLDAVALVNAVEYTPATALTTLLGEPTIQGVIANFWINPLDVTVNIYFSASDDTPDIYSQRYRYLGTADSNRQVMTQLLFIPVGPDGNIKILCNGSDSTAYMTVIGYWK